MKRSIGRIIASRGLLSIGLVSLSHAALAGPIGGADVSSLPDIEREGGVFRDHGKPGDEIAILRAHGCDLFRVRLFVDPNTDPAKNYGATQNLDMVRGLAKRIKAAGGQFLLDIHYSDTWADPTHQTKPAAWQALDFDALQQRVTDYTASVLKDLRDAGAEPDMVQVGNEITGGMLWPDARLSHGPKDQEPQQWQRFAKLLAAGVKAVRAAEHDGKRIRVVLHIHGGGHEGLPPWFFKQFMANGGEAVDFDVIGLSFYPAWKDDIVHLKKNMADLVNAYGKDILLAEVGYAWTPVTDIEGRESMRWPMTKEGQAQYLRDTREALADLPGGHGLGYVWWYSDAIPVNGRRVWRDGDEALFDHDGNALPALDVFAQKP